MQEGRMLKFALAGNPNAGKTTLFNALTGSTAHVGNWPGVTVDKRTGTYKKGSEPVDIVDLPGIYSLSPYTPEEVIARNFLLEESPDCIINIVDATNLERNLYLTTQLMELDVPMVVALNMTDVLDKRGDKIDVRLLEKRIGLPVVEISALKGANAELLMTRAMDAAKEKRQGSSVLRESVLGSAIANAEIALKLKEVPAPLFHAIKLVEKDGIEVKNHPHEARAVESFIRENVCAKDGFCGDAEAEIADARYKYITAHFSSTLTRARKPSYDELSKSDKADKVLTHKIWGLPIFVVILFGIFHLTFAADFLYLGAIVKPFAEFSARMAESTVGAVFFGEGDGLCAPGTILFNAMELLTGQIDTWLANGLDGVGANPILMDFVSTGLWGGVAAVLSFLPQILVLFLFFSILEDTGYMARVAFMLDRIFRRFGVSGRAFMPMIMGFGCSVPAMINTRTMADEKEREATVRVIPFFSCGAKMPILVAISAALAVRTNLDAGLVTLSMYVLGITVALLSLLVMRNTTMRGEASPFIMELPTYHMPGFRNLMLHLWDKAKHFIQKAFTIILLSCMIIWFLSNFGWDWKHVGMITLENGEEVLNIENSILASVGRFIQPFFTPLGFGSQLNANGWVFAVAAITGLIAKEDVIATFGSLALCLGAVLTEEQLGEGVDQVTYLISQTGISSAGLLAFIAFNMLTIPCFAAVAAARGEVGKGKFKWTLLFWIFVSFVVASIVYCFCSMFASWSAWSIVTSILWVAIGAAAVVGIVMYNKYMDKKEQRLRLNKKL
ncbi:MAG: ferrous iron transport protein B [Clostridia bacterium]|nr:ferrous iron transport protein B [Clostridia bacterium]